MSRLSWAVWVVVCSGAPAWAGGWSGVWTVDGETQLRVVEQTRGRLSVSVDWPGLGRVRLRGEGGEGDLRLRGEWTETAGISQILRGEQRSAPEVTKLELRAIHERGPDGERLAAVEWRRGGEVRWRERWVRAGEPSLRIAQAPRSPCDPQAEGPLRWRVRVLGRPQALELRVELAGRDAGRLAYYRGRRTLVVRRLGEFAVGEHEIEWSGRDGTRTRRVALAGGYRLVLRGGGAARVEVPTRVVLPRACLLDPAWPRRAPSTLGDMRGGLERAGYHVRRWGGQPDDARVFELLRRSAVVWIRTHGNRNGFAVYRGEGEAGRVATFSPARLRRQLARSGGSLQDLKAVLIYSCLVGDDGGAQLPQALLDAGADCVVSFGRTILSMGHTPWQRELSRWVQAGGSLREASRKAAAYADRTTWGRYSIGWQRRQWARGVRPLAECLVFKVAAGVDPHAISLTPASYGRTDN